MASPGHAGTGIGSPIGYRVGPFEADLRRCELRKFGVRMRLERKPWQLLTSLLESSGRVVTRAELIRQLWDEGVFVDFDHGLNVAVQKVREALGDSAENPQFIETVAGEGYRFIAPVERVAPSDVAKETSKPVSVTSPIVSANPKEQSHPSLRQPRWLALSSITILIATGLLAWNTLHHPAPLLRESGWVLIADFDNRTGERVLDGTLEYELERELSNSRFVKVVPHERVEDVLLLMKKPLDSKIDRALGREVCLRDGEIRALIAGRIEKLGATYVLSAEIRNPASGIVFASFSEEDQQDVKLASAVRRLSARVRKALGENPNLVRQSLENLEKVTTPSLHALQLYSEANRLITRTPIDYWRNEPEVIGLLEEALKEDPDFASAHLELAYAYQMTTQDDKAQPHYLRAMQLSSTLPDREKLFITGAYYGFALDKPDEAIQAYESLLRLYPDHYWGTKNLFNLYMRFDRFEQAANLAQRLLELRPVDFHEAVLTASLLVDPFGFGRIDQPSDEAYNRKFQIAQSYAARVLGMLQLHGNDVPNVDMGLLRLVLSREAWILRNTAEFNSQFQLALAQHHPGDGLDRLVVSFAAAVGRLNEARQLSSSTPRPDPGVEAAVAFYCGDLEGTRKYLRQLPERPPDWTTEMVVPLMIQVGMLREADRLGRKLIQRRPLYNVSNVRGTYSLEMRVDAYQFVVEGVLALAAGKAKEGIAILAPILHKRPHSAGASLAYELLAHEYRRQSDFKDILAILEEGAAYRGTPFNFSAAYRLRLKLKLADLYRELGRTSDAEKVEAGLREDLMFADADHPILLALHDRRGSNVSGAQTNTVASTATK